MGFLEIITFLAAVCNFLLGFLVFIKNPTKKINRLFGIFSFITAIWVFSNFMVMAQPSVFWLKSAYAFAVLVSASAVLWILELCDKKIAKFKITLIATLTLLFFLISYVNNLVINIKRVYLGGFEGRIGFLFPLYFIYIFGILTFLIYTLISTYHEAKGVRKAQLKYILTGVVLYVSIVLVVSLILPLLGNFKFSALDSPSSLILLIFTAFAIIKHRFMDIRIVTGRSAIYLLSFATIVSLIFLFMFLNNQLVQPLPFNAVSLLIIGTLFSSFFFQLLKLYEKIAEEYFYHTFYNTKIIIAELEEKLTQVLELKTFSFLITNTLMNVLKLEKIGILVREIGDTTFLAKRTIGFSEEQILSLVEDKFLIHYLQKTKKPILQEELTLSITKAKGEEKEKLQKLQAEMKQIEANLLLLFIFERNLIGIIVLGNKVSGDAFYSQDIELLTTLSRSASIALKNASLYSEVKNRKEELERFYRLTVGRELQMKELKDRIIELEKKLKER